MELRQNIIAFFLGLGQLEPMNEQSELFRVMTW